MLIPRLQSCRHGLRLQPGRRCGGRRAGPWRSRNADSQRSSRPQRSLHRSRWRRESWSVTSCAPFRRRRRTTAFATVRGLLPRNPRARRWGHLSRRQPGWPAPRWSKSLDAGALTLGGGGGAGALADDPPLSALSPVVEPSTLSSRTPRGRTYASSRARRSQSRRPSASVLTASTRVSLTWRQSPNGASAPASASAASAACRASDSVGLARAHLVRGERVQDNAEQHGREATQQEVRNCPTGPRSARPTGSAAEEG